MLRDVIGGMSEPQLRVLVENMVDACEKDCPDIVPKTVMETYYELYGCHFNEQLLKIAVSDMENEDGTHGGKWTVGETTSVAKNYGISFDKFNEYDWNYAMNMVYSDYYGAVGNETSSYVKLAHKFLCDRDATDGKAIKYYFSMSML